MAKKGKVGDAVQRVVSSLAISLFQKNLDKGKSIYIPSLDITIYPEEKENGQSTKTSS